MSHSTSSGSHQYFSPAKINLFLHITGRRNNGYHDLQTIFQLLNFGDQIQFANTDNGHLSLQLSDHSTIELDDGNTDNNLIIKAARLLQKYSDKNYGASISLEKHIPLGAGLGGGSSNAATTLIALNQLWDTQLNKQQLCQLGVQLGADVPIFITQKNAIAEGVGEKITEVDTPERWFIVVTPKIFVSTAEIFNHDDIQRSTAPIALATLQSQIDALVDGGTIVDSKNKPITIGNDCQSTVDKCFPQIAKAKRALSQIITKYCNESTPVRLTGTGSSFFAVLNNQTLANDIYAEVIQVAKQQQWRAFLSTNL